jgi:hypothetical protein
MNDQFISMKKDFAFLSVLDLKQIYHAYKNEILHVEFWDWST